MSNQTFNMDKMKAQLILSEGNVLHVYQDGRGYWTIGVGHCIDPRAGCAIPASQFMAYCIQGITPVESDALLQQDIEAHAATLDAELSWWTDFDDSRQRAMLALCFNMGIEHLLEFHEMLAAWQAGNWAEAGAQLQNSAWWGEVGDRGPRIQRMIETGD